MINPRLETRTEADAETKYDLYVPLLTMLKISNVNCRADSKLSVAYSPVRLASDFRQF